MIISVTMDFALDHSTTYSGGLGVLEGDKFYAMARLGIPYTVLTLFYRQGYVQQKIVNDSLVIEGEPTPASFLASLHPEPDMKLWLNDEWVIVRPLVYTLHSARAVFFEAVCPAWARVLSDRLYIEAEPFHRFLKHVFLAKAAVAYTESRLDRNEIETFDLQEAKAGFAAAAIASDRLGFVTHTPGPWGHPVFPRASIQNEFSRWHLAGLFPDLDKEDDPVNVTRFVMKRTRRIFAVSKKHARITRGLFPSVADSIRPATNGIDLQRWQDPQIAEAVDTEDFDRFVQTRHLLRSDLLEELEHSRDEGPIILWSRRLTRYKRPDFVVRFIETHPDVHAIYCLGGRPHPQDQFGITIGRSFFQLAQSHPAVHFIPTFNLEKAKHLLSRVDLLLFTPFSGWEACGTSFMKAGVNGVPTIASRDGGALEMIRDTKNGWLFGDNIEEVIDIYNDDRATAINEKEYLDFEKTLLAVIRLFHEDRASFNRIAFQAALDFTMNADVRRLLHVLYPIHVPPSGHAV